MSCRPHHNIVSFICENDQIFDWNFIEKPMKLEPSDILKKNKDKNDKPEEFKPNRLDYSPDGKWLSIATK